MGKIKKVDLHSMKIDENKKKQLKQFFPEVFSEGKIDFEKLKLTLGEAVEAGKDRYDFTWAERKIPRKGNLS